MNKKSVRERVSILVRNHDATTRRAAGGNRCEPRPPEQRRQGEGRGENAAAALRAALAGTRAPVRNRCRYSMPGTSSFLPILRRSVPPIRESALLTKRNPAYVIIAAGAGRASGAGVAHAREVSPLSRRPPQRQALDLLGQQLVLLVAVAQLANTSMAPAPTGAVGGDREAVAASSRHSDDALAS